MPLEKRIIKSQVAEHATFAYQPRDLHQEVSTEAREFVRDEAAQVNDFKISELIARQNGISKLESDAHQDQINEQVLNRLKEVQERAYKEGFELGQVEGTEKAFQETKAQITEKLSQMEGLIQTIQDLKTRLLVDNEGELVDLVYFAAKKMALRDLAENREAVVEILKTVLDEVQADETVIVRICQQDFDFIETMQSKADKKMEILGKVKLMVDEKVSPGGCLIETEYGTVDATVEVRVDRVWQTLLSRVPQNPPKES